jgi:hypothetical protein
MHTEGKRLLGNPRLGCEGNIKWMLWYGMTSIDLTEDKD